jgi:ribosomal protein S18 acetylase RimI-like enzyme
MKIIQPTEITTEILNAFKTLTKQLSHEKISPSKKDLEEIVNSENSILFIAKDENEEIAGTLTLLINRIPTGQKVWIEDVVVDNKFRGKGIGQKLTQHAIDYAIKKGIKEINLTSNPARIAGNKLYQKLGFIKRTTNFYRLKIE